MSIAAEAAHVSNPFAGADQYINPDYSREIAYSIAQSPDAAMKAGMQQLQSVPTAIWLDRIEAIAGGAKNNGRSSLQQHLQRALSQQRKGVALVVPLVVYNLPNRDCAAMSSNGTLDFRSGGLERYKAEYIDVIANLISQPRFASLRIVLMIEPDSLPNMVTNLWNKKCQLVHDQHIYEQGIAYAINRLSKPENSYLYMDIGHSGWLGWDQALRDTVTYYAAVVRGAGQGLGVIDGFVSNVSGSTPSEELYLPNPNKRIAGAPLKSADFFSWNPLFDEKHYAERLYESFVQAGFSPSLKFLIDTSRNGWGGKQRPRGAQRAASVNAYVEHARLDRRYHRGNWCNPSGAGLGARPQAEPYGATHPVGAFIWVKPPGESDGTSDPSQHEADAEGKRYDKMCDPNYVVDYGPNPSHKPTGALSGAPAAGHWFHKQFTMLIRNAYPPLTVK